MSCFSVFPRRWISRPHRGCNVRPAEITANCAAVAAVAATAKAYTGPPRPRNEFTNVRNTRSATPKPTDPKSVCKPAGRQQTKACPTSAKKSAEADACAKAGSGAGVEADEGTCLETGANSGPGDWCVNSHPICQNYTGGYEQGHCAHGHGAHNQWQVCTPQSQGQFYGSYGHSQLQGQPSESHYQASGSQIDASGKVECQVEDCSNLAACREEIAKRGKKPQSAGSCVCDGSVTPANASFRSKTPRFAGDSPDSRPWYCTAPNLHEINLPRTSLHPAPQNAPFYRSGARFSVDTRFRAPAPNTYLPPVLLGKTRWSGVLSGYHGIPACYNIVDRNCDLSTVHMHCVMCPPRGIYDKSIGQPLHEIFPDAKLREEQMRHMCTWHSGEVKRAYHQRGMFTRGCTEGISGRSNIGPSGFRTNTFGCSCCRRDHHGIPDDATLERMAADLNRKKRDPDLSMIPTMCQKFDADAEASAADKLKKALERAEECKKRCKEYKKNRREDDTKGGETKKSETSKPRSPRGDAREYRLPKVTEGGEDVQTDFTECYDELGQANPTKNQAGTSDGRLLFETSNAYPRDTECPPGTEYFQRTATECIQEVETGYVQERCTPDTSSAKPSFKVSEASSKTSQKAGSAGTECNGHQSPGAAAPEGSRSPRSRSKCPCAAITLQCKCSVYNKGTSMSFPKQCTPQTDSQPQYNQQNPTQYGQQRLLPPQDQLGQYGQEQYGQQYAAQCQQARYGIQDRQEQQFGVQTLQQQQYGRQGEQYGIVDQECVPPNQQYGNQDQQFRSEVQQGQQYCTHEQAQQYRTQGQQYGSHSLQQEYPPGPVGASCPPGPPHDKTLAQQQQKSGADSGITQFYKQCTSGPNVSLGSSVASCPTPNTPRRISKHDSTNTYDDDY